MFHARSFLVLHSHATTIHCPSYSHLAHQILYSNMLRSSSAPFVNPADCSVIRIRWIGLDCRFWCGYKQGRIKWRACHAALGYLKLDHILKRCASSNYRKNDKYYPLNEITRLHRFTYSSTRSHLSRRHFMLNYLYFLLFYTLYWELCWPTQLAY